MEPCCLACEKPINKENCFSIAYVNRKSGTRIFAHDIFLHESCLYEHLTSDLKEKLEVRIVLAELFKSP